MKNISRTILIGILITVTCSLSAAPVDSIGMEKQGNQVVVLHKVDQGETLFSISRKYGADINAIRSANPGVEGLDIGQVIKVPLPATKEIPSDAIQHTVAQSETLFSISRKYEVSVDDIKKWNGMTSNELSIGQVIIVGRSGNTTPAASTEVVPTEGKKTHTVAAGETLYSISKKYEVDIESIKQWNNLQDNTLSLGQVIVVGEGAQAVVQETQTQTDTNTYTEIDVPPTTTTTTGSENSKFEKITENGLAEVIDGTGNTRKYLAFHKTAPIGTIMQVKNEMNGLTVFVRVLGKLPDTEENKLIVCKLSEKAYKKLGAVDKRFRVQLVYSP